MKKKLCERKKERKEFKLCEKKILSCVRGKTFQLCEKKF